MAKETTASVITATSSIANTALEKKMNEQMTKGSVVIDSTPTNPNDTNLLPVQTVPIESMVKKSPSKVNNNA